MHKLTPDELVGWAIAICLTLLFVSCGLSALLNVVQ
jgi:hypothetical protein